MSSVKCIILSKLLRGAARHACNVRAPRQLVYIYTKKETLAMNNHIELAYTTFKNHAKTCNHHATTESSNVTLF
jgi:hypothetical protein